MAIWAGEGRGTDGIIQITLKTEVVKKFPFLKRSSISLVLQSLSFLGNVCLSLFSISESDFPGMLRKVFRTGKPEQVIYYLQFLLNSFRYSSRAIVIDGALGLGALISSLRPSCSTALAVVGPKAAIFISPWTKSGKFSLSDFMPDGL